MSAAGIILAAGESRRMGFPKALLRYREETFLDTLIGLFAARCQPVIVVLGAHGDRIRERTQRPATFVINPDYQRGQTSSMQCGLRAVPPDAGGRSLHPGGSSGRRARHARCAARRTRTAERVPGPLVRVPRHGGRRGHPIWFSRDLIAEFLALPENGAAREIVRSHAAQTEFLDVDDAGILADIDDAAAYGRLTGATL